ncbi:MrpH family fimbial adhesin [Providencia manganoxydans]|uniref:MrpH family fimbial adhesin n=1 Tax=Providencia manganoxydans TaxID=2923283 RepID=UPI0034E546D0
MKKKLSILFLTCGLFISNSDAATIITQYFGTRINNQNLDAILSVNSSYGSQYWFVPVNSTYCIEKNVPQSRVGCYVYTLMQTYNYSLTINGGLSDRPFSTATGGASCYLNVAVGYDNNGAYDWRSNGIKAQMQGNDGGGLISSDTLKVINKPCSAMTVADIGTISGSLSGYLFMGPTNTINYNYAFGNPGPPWRQTLSVLLVAKTSNTSWGSNSSGTYYLYESTQITPETPPASPIECNLNGVLEINHGVIDSNSIEGNKATADFQLMCNGQARANLRILNSGGTSYLTVGDGIISNITILPNSMLDVSASRPVDFSIQSILSKMGQVIPGNYSASTTLVITYQ